MRLIWLALRRPAPGRSPAGWRARPPRPAPPARSTTRPAGRSAPRPRPPRQPLGRPLTNSYGCDPAGALPVHEDQFLEKPILVAGQGTLNPQPTRGSRSQRNRSPLWRCREVSRPGRGSVTGTPRHVYRHHSMPIDVPGGRPPLRTTLALDDALILEAQRLTGTSEKSALVRQALRALIERESARRLSQLGGSEPDAKAIPRRQATPA